MLLELLVRVKFASLARSILPPANVRASPAALNSAVTATSIFSSSTDDVESLSVVAVMVVVPPSNL